MGSTVYLSSQSFPSLYLNDGDRTVQPRYTGTGSPWETQGTTPYRIANNDDTGERWLLNAPDPAPVTDGGPPFALAGRTIGLQYTNRIITIAIQAYATEQRYLGTLLAEIRRRVISAMTQSVVSLNVIYDGQAVVLHVERGRLQEGPQYWNAEEGKGIIRAVLTLECGPGVGAPVFLQSAATYTNAVDGSAAPFTGLSGDWSRSNGQGVYIRLSGGEMASASAKVFYVATLAGSGDSSALSGPISTTSTTGVNVAGLAGYNTMPNRGTRIRVMAHITAPNAALQIRYVVRIGSALGAVLATGEWVSAGASTTILDLGYIALSQTLADLGAATISVTVQARSSSGALATGTLSRIRLLEYYTFCRIPATTANTNEVLQLTSLYPAPEDTPLALTFFGSVTTQLCAFAGQLPRVYEGMQLWVAWTANGVFNPAATVTVTVLSVPIHETLPEP